MNKRYNGYEDRYSGEKRKTYERRNSYDDHHKKKRKLEDERYNNERKKYDRRDYKRYDRREYNRNVERNYDRYDRDNRYERRDYDRRNRNRRNYDERDYEKRGYDKYNRRTIHRYNDRSDSNVGRDKKKVFEKRRKLRRDEEIEKRSNTTKREEISHPEQRKEEKRNLKTTETKAEIKIEKRKNIEPIIKKKVSFKEEKNNSKPNNKDKTVEKKKLLKPKPKLLVGIIEEEEEKDFFEDEEDTFDMFADNDDLPSDNENEEREERSTAVQAVNNFDDHEGYYKATINEIINSRYKITSTSIGRGVFSDVVLCLDQTTNTHVAMKIIRNNEAMKKSGRIEISNLGRIKRGSSDQGKYCVNMLDSFKYSNHLCIVYEKLEMNLREVVNNFGKIGGRKVGINLKAIRIYGYQLLRALKSCKEAQIIHADFKPDNILINKEKTSVCLADFGSSFGINEVMASPELQTGWYRAPEIILGINYDYGIDLWSLGCTLVELFTGQILFKSKNNNDHLKLIMEYVGEISPKLLRRSLFKEHHFDDKNQFMYVEKDVIDEEDFIARKFIVKKNKSFRSLLFRYAEDDSEEFKEQLFNFIDFLQRVFVFNPSKRITVESSLKHPFFTNIQK